MNFSSILDISSFFIGMIINLLLVALVSYYFKRKYDYLEKSINEHSDHIYMLLKKERDSLRKLSESMNNKNELQQELRKNLYPSLVNSNECSDSQSDSDEEEINSRQTYNLVINSDEDSDEYSDDEESDAEDIEELDEKNIPNEAKVLVEELNDINEDIVKQLTIQDISNEEPTKTFNIQKVLSHDYNKLTMKQLKDLLSNKGIQVKPNMKKNDLVDLASKNEIEVEIESLSKNPSHISLSDCDLGLTNMNDEVTTIE
jgi:hypothetical protein